MVGRFATLEDLVRHGDIAIPNLLTDSELQDPMGEHGYPPARMREIDAQRQQVRLHIQRYDDEHSEKVGASKARQEARDALIEVLRLDRALLTIRYKRNPQRKDQLGLDEELSLTYSGLRRQGRQLYDAIQNSAEVQAEVAERGLTQEKLAQRLALLTRFEDADRAYNTEAGEAHDAREQRDDQADAFAEELADLLDTARVVFAGRPLLLQKLGLA